MSSSPCSSFSLRNLPVEAGLRPPTQTHRVSVLLRTRCISYLLTVHQRLYAVQHPRDREGDRPGQKPGAEQYDARPQTLYEK